MYHLLWKFVLLQSLDDDDDDDMMMMMKTTTLPIKGMVITALCCHTCVHSAYSETTEIITNLKYRP